MYVPEWTDDPKKINNPDLQGVYHSINAVMAHEFGHTLGLKHLPADADPDGKIHMMSQGTKWLKDTIEPSASDLYGLLEVTRGHH